MPWLDGAWMPRWVGRLCGALAVVPEGRRYVSERVGGSEGVCEEDSPWGDEGEGSLLYESE